MKLSILDVRDDTYPTESAPPKEYPIMWAVGHWTWSSKRSSRLWNKPGSWGNTGVSVRPWPHRSTKTKCVCGNAACNTRVSGSIPIAGVCMPWIRRTRAGFDCFEVVVVPVDEGGKS